MRTRKQTINEVDSHESSTFSTSGLKVNFPLHSEKHENEVDESEVPKKKGKVRNGIDNKLNET